MISLVSLPHAEKLRCKLPQQHVTGKVSARVGCGAMREGCRFFGPDRFQFFEFIEFLNAFQLLEFVESVFAVSPGFCCHNEYS